MFIKEKTLDDLLIRIYKRLLSQKHTIAATKGNFKELTGVLLCLTHPRARLSRAEGKGKLFSCLGELLWYLAGSDDLAFIEHYIPAYRQSSDNGATIHGAYGPRMFGAGANSQLQTIIDTLKTKRTSRQAVIQLFDAKDILEPHNDVPCTCTLQFLVRANELQMLTNMRSNDVFLGLPHDIFAFTMIQEIVARSLGCELGNYTHFVGSLHLYERNFEQAKSYINGGYQPIVEMPEMPACDPWQSIESLIKAEELSRQSADITTIKSQLDPYWSDLINILEFFSCTKKKADPSKMRLILSQIDSDVYKSYLENRKMTITRKADPLQLDIVLK